MGKLVGHLSLGLKVGGFDDQAVGVTTVFEQIIRPSAIADVYQARAAASRSEHIFR